MRPQLYAVMMLLGVVLTVHLAMNGKVGAAIGNPRVANAVFWVIGAIGAIAIGLTGWQAGALGGLKNVNPILLTAGLMGASLVFGIAWAIPQIGAGPAMLLLIAGQIVGGIVVSHFGWLGSPVQPVTMKTLLGVAVMFAGVFIATRR
jgi:bacterial/archaeal transporter family-2 protein